MTVCCDCGIVVGESEILFFSRKSAGYVCTPCLRKRQENRPVVCHWCGAEDEHLSTGCWHYGEVKSNGGDVYGG
jgi:hypothetical protein